MKIPNGELRRLNRFFFAVLEDVSNVYGVAPGLILNARRKSRRGGDIVGARHTLATTMRAYVHQRGKGSGLRFEFYPDGLPRGVSPISFPNVAEWLGLDHSTLVHGSHRAEKARVLPFPKKILAVADKSFSAGA